MASGGGSEGEGEGGAVDPPDLGVVRGGRGGKGGGGGGGGGSGLTVDVYVGLWAVWVMVGRREVDLRVVRVGVRGRGDVLHVPPWRGGGRVLEVHVL